MRPAGTRGWAFEVNQFETQEFVKADGASDVHYMEHRGGISSFRGHSGEIVLLHVCLAQQDVATGCGDLALVWGVFLPLEVTTTEKIGERKDR